MAAAARGYLLLYTLAQLAGTAIVLCLAFGSLGRGPAAVYEACGAPVKLMQTLSLLEVLHAAFGLVRSSPMTTLAQIYSRLHIVWFIVDAVPSAARTRLQVPGAPPGVALSYATMIIAWGFAETIRYTYYAFSITGSVPYVVKWIRYTAFYALYPLGVASELTLCYLATPTLKATGMMSYRMPNAWNIDFSFWWFNTYCICIAGYSFWFPVLYMHMIKQRAKALGGAAKKKDA